MKLLSKATLCLSLVLGLALVGSVPATAQTVTTGVISGAVVDPQGGVLPGATVVAIHVPTGTTYESVTQADGRYSLLNVRSGGPYTVTVTMPGFRVDEQTGITVNLGEERALNFTLRLESVAETVTVTGAAPVIDTLRAGTSANISTEVKETLPTISRSLIDVVRSNPYFNAITQNNSVTAVSVAGRNERYNSIQIDGAVNNDLFGLAATGTPGGQTDTQPISFDAIAQIQLVVSPYDVRQGGFSGGGINAVTKSGSNQLSGTVFYFGRNQDWIGEGITGTPVANFKDQQMGGTVGGRLIENKAFFFGSADWGRRSTPTGFCLTGCGQTFAGAPADVDRFFNILESKYGYTVPNARETFSRTTDSDKFLGKIDVNLNSQHRLTVRHNYVDGLNDIGGTGRTSYTTPDGFYRIRSKTNSSVMQLNSTFGNAVNEFRVAYTRVRDRRGGQPFETKAFPRTTVRIASGIQLTVGRENFSTANELDQDIVEIHDDFTMIRGQHTITIGTHNEFFKFRNLFIRDNFGTYTFNSLDFFDQGLAQQFAYSYPVDPGKPAAAFAVRSLGLYIGDQWRVRPNVTLTMGARVDVPLFPDKPTANPAAITNFGYATDTTPGGLNYSPRIGFNWDLKSDGTQQLRGGIGMFSGRTPYVWLSNQYGNTGIEFQRIGASNNGNNRIPYVTNAAGQPTTVTGAGGSSFTNEIDLVDPDYSYPVLLRGNLAYERELPWGLVGSVEGLFTKDIQDVKYQNLNRVASGLVQPVGNIPRYTRVNNDFSDVIFLTNSSEGYSWSGVAELRRPFSNGWYFSSSYLYGRSKSIMDGTSSQAASNWGNTLIRTNPNEPELATSVYDPGHRVTFSMSKEIPLFGGATATTSLYYSGQSGRPYTLRFFNDVNGDGRSSDLLYIPASASEIPFTGGTHQNLINYLQNSGCLTDFIGQIIPRNVCRAPWSNTLDFRLNVALPFQRVKAEVTLDVLNVFNLLNSGWGQQEYATFNSVAPVTATLSNGVITAYNVSFLTGSSFRPFNRDDLRSRWQMQLGGRLRF
ncbi:MAG: carboxypeptidase regulatory-like domain-containing protein [Acidobacteria bacterium]|nr:carboxypeptidase regulatory-like domain-containing protein [Acidobacteriota bacterium]